MLQLFTVTLAAGEEKPFTMEGRFIRLLDGDGNIEVRTDRQQGALIQGLGAEFEPFQWLRVKSEQAQTIRIVVSNLPTTDNRTQGNVLVEPHEDINVKGALTVPTTGTVTVAANTARKSVSIRADQGNGGPIHLNTGGKLFPLYPGDTIRENVTGEIKLSTNQGSSQTAFVYEVE